jgi:hypothetical protein
MCIIIDANVSHELFPRNESISVTEDAKPVLKRIQEGTLIIVIGHQLKIELLKSRFRNLYKQLLLAGSLVEFSDDEVNPRYEIVRGMECKSNDQHVLALAQVSGARILFSHDKNLHKDFKNTSIVPSPKGKVYQYCHQQRILDETKCTCG